MGCLACYTGTIGGCKLFRRDRQGRRCSGVALYVRDSYECIELNHSDDMAKCLWLRIRRKANKANTVVGVCYRPSDHGREADEPFYKQLGEVSQSLVLIVGGNFNLPECCKYNTEERKQLQRFLECVEDNLLMRLASEPTKGRCPLLILNRGLLGDVTTGGHLGHNHNEIIEFS